MFGVQIFFRRVCIQPCRRPPRREQSSGEKRNVDVKSHAGVIVLQRSVMFGKFAGSAEKVDRRQTQTLFRFCVLLAERAFISTARTSGRCFRPGSQVGRGPGSSPAVATDPPARPSHRWFHPWMRASCARLSRTTSSACTTANSASDSRTCAKLTSSVDFRSPWACNVTWCKVSCRFLSVSLHGAQRGFTA